MGVKRAAASPRRTAARAPRGKPAPPPRCARSRWSDLGIKWRGNFDARLTVDGLYTVLANRPDGEVMKFYRADSTSPDRGVRRARHVVEMSAAAW